MTNLPLSVMNLISLRLFLLLLTVFCGWFSWLGLNRFICFPKSTSHWRWGAFGFSFLFLSAFLYYLQVKPGDQFRQLTDTTRPRQLRAIFVRPSRAMLFWETGEPATGFVLFGFSPNKLVYLVKQDEPQPKIRHSVVISEPVPAGGFYAFFYSDGKQYPADEEPLYFPR